MPQVDPSASKKMRGVLFLNDLGRSTCTVGPRRSSELETFETMKHLLRLAAG